MFLLGGSRYLVISGFNILFYGKIGAVQSGFFVGSRNQAFKALVELDL